MIYITIYNSNRFKPIDSKYLYIIMIAQRRDLGKNTF